MTAESHQAPLLLTQLRWLVGLRWIAGVCVVALALAQRLWLHWYPGWAQMLIVGVSILLYNAVIWATLRPRSHDPPPPALHTLSLAQISFDLACLTLLAAWTGGPASPVMGFFVFHMIFASLLLTRVWAFAAAGAAIAMVAGAFRLTGEWPTDRAGAMLALGWAGMLLVAVYLTSHITVALYRRERSRLQHIRRAHSMSAHLHAQERAMVQHEKMVAMGQLAAGVAHEINNPLAGMDGLLQLMERHPDCPRPQSIEQLRAQIDRIQRIVRQLTAFAHPERGRPESGDVNEVIRATLKLPGFESRLRKVQVTCDLPDGAVPARMVPRALQQALMNLIINALDALAQTPEPRLLIRARSFNGQVIIDVCDNGPGIAPEHMGRLFEPFFTTKPVGQGTGLGLSISRGLINEQRGRLEATSPAQDGRGARFTITLPSGAANAPSEPAAPDEVGARA